MPFPITRDLIVESENKLGCTFPESFVNKMMNDNGGSVQPPGLSEEEAYSWFLFPFYDTSSPKLIARTCNDIVKETIKAREEYGLPENLVAIGEDGSGGYLVYVIEDGKCKDEIFAWYCDEEVEDLEKVVNDFSEFTLEENER